MQRNTPKKPSQQDWDAIDIKAALYKKGITLSGLAQAHGLKDSSGLSVALVRSFPAGEKRIAEALGMHPMAIWPSRYHEDGSRKPQGFRSLQFNAASVARNSKGAATGGEIAKAA